MSTCRRFLFALGLACWLATPGPARLGETLSDLTKRFDRPLSQTAKDNASWLFEVEDGPVLYSVTFNAKGQSIAEGLKPVKRALFTKKTAMTFIEGQLADFADSPTKRIVPPGEKYNFAGQVLTCGRNEYVVLDDARGLLLVWMQGAEPAVMVVSPEMLRRGK